MSVEDPDFTRYARQMQLPGFGPEGQRRLSQARVLVAGCGALGTVASELLVRAGVGTVTIVDRDLVERSNLQRQSLFTEQDARRAVPKAEAAKARLVQINPSVAVRACVDDLRGDNALAYAADADLVIDCLDNFETRLVLNECAVLRRIPLVYGGAVGFAGMAAALLPAPRASMAGFGGAIVWSETRSTPCLRCLMPDAPAPGEAETCDVAGILAPVAAAVASIEAAFALRLIAEGAASVPAELVRMDLAAMRFTSASLEGARDPHCGCCALGRLELLESEEMREEARNGRGTTRRSPYTVLCGRNAVEVRLGASVSSEEFERIESRLRAAGEVAHGVHGATRVLRVALPRDATGGGATALSVLSGTGGTLAIIDGTRDPEQARSCVARWIGV